MFVLCQEEHDPQFEPVIRLTEQVETKTHEENEDATFKMCVAAVSLIPPHYLLHLRCPTMKACEALQIRHWSCGVEGAWYRRCSSVETQGDQEGQTCYEKRQDIESLRKSYQ